MENTEDWGICRNNTTATIGVYGYDPDKKNATPELAYVGPGQETDNDWACTGVYLPGDAQVTGLDLKGEPAIAEIVDGTRLTISQNPDTQALEFDVPIYRLRQGAEGNLPQLTQAEVSAAVPNAPVD